MEFNDTELNIIKFALSYLASGSYIADEDVQAHFEALMKRLEITSLGEESEPTEQYLCPSIYEDGEVKNCTCGKCDSKGHESVTFTPN